MSVSRDPIVWIALRRYCRSALILFVWASCPLLSQAQLDLDYATGKALFDKNWVPAPASTGASDGLGPFYDARSCAQCHPDGGRGSRAQSLTLHIDDPVYGGRLQKYAVPGFAPEAHVDFGRSADGKTTVAIRDLRYGALENPAQSPRIAPSLRGVGLLAAIPDAVLAAGADPDDSDGDGISGRLNRVQDLAGNLVIGRFGWKAARATLADQSAIALSLDLGLGSPGLPAPAGDCTARQNDCLVRPHGGGREAGTEEVGAQALALLLTYVRGLPAPLRVDSSESRPRRGEDVFEQIGCADCHQPVIETPGGTLHPYTDLLLHDMGPGLADTLEEGVARGGEWRTAPLWGLGSVPTDYLHDGRAATLEEAIDWHGGEAEAARNNYRNLNDRQQDDVIAFLFSL